ncbi:VOC family protein [Amycolatopsis samaneae]
MDVLGLVVADMAASLDFYRRLGLDIPAGAEHESHVEATLPGGFRVLWDTVENIRSFEPGWEGRGATNQLGLAFGCADAAEVDRVHAELVDAGFRSERAPWDAFWGQRYATVLDPDGTGVDLYAPL